LARRPVGLTERIRWAIELYPCDLLFVHRDADREPREKRVHEIAQALDEIAGAVPVPPSICVVPIRMLEAWLLFDEQALRGAAGNPGGRVDLDLPPMSVLESMPDPKSKLRTTLRNASELAARRREKLLISPDRVAALTDDFSPLRALSAFRHFEADLDRALDERLVAQ